MFMLAIPFAAFSVVAFYNENPGLCNTIVKHIACVLFGAASVFCMIASIFASDKFIKWQISWEQFFRGF